MCIHNAAFLDFFWIFSFLHRWNWHRHNDNIYSLSEKKSSRYQKKCLFAILFLPNQQYASQGTRRSQFYYSFIPYTAVQRIGKLTFGSPSVSPFFILATN
jgi:hypothetical protein